MISQLVTRIQWNQPLCCIYPRVDWGNDLTMIVTCAAFTPLVISRVPRGVAFNLPNARRCSSSPTNNLTEKTDGENSNRVELFILGGFCDTNIHLRDGWLAAVDRCQLHAPARQSALNICICAAPADDDDDETFECVTCWFLQVCQPTRFIFFSLGACAGDGQMFARCSLLSANRLQIFFARGGKDSVKRPYVWFYTLMVNRHQKLLIFGCKLEFIVNAIWSDHHITLRSWEFQGLSSMWQSHWILCPLFHVAPH